MFHCRLPREDRSIRKFWSTRNKFRRSLVWYGETSVSNCSGPPAHEVEGAGTMRRLATALFAASIAAVGSSGAGQAEISAAQRVIEAQLKAFQADDGARAYSYAAPGVKRIFPSVDAFMSMVESGYLPVRRPKRYSFGK